MEKEDEFKEEVGEIVWNVMLEEVEGGRMDKGEVKKLALKLGGQCNALFKDEEAMPTFKTSTVFRKVLDVWMMNYAHKFPSKKDKVDHFVKVLIEIKRPDLANRIESNETTSNKTKDSGIKMETTSIETKDSGIKMKDIKTSWSSVKPIAPPGTRATFDDQGNTFLCTPHAMAKVIFDGLHEGEWTNGVQIDAVGTTEQLVNEKMVHVHKGKRIWPSAFHEQSVYVTTEDEDKNKFCYDVKLSTKTLYPNKMDDGPKFSEDDCRLFAILVKGTDRENHALHSLYCKEYSSELREFSCINSWGSVDSFPKVKDDDKSIECLTFVNATVEKLY